MKGLRVMSGEGKRDVARTGDGAKSGRGRGEGKRDVARTGDGAKNGLERGERSRGEQGEARQGDKGMIQRLKERIGRKDTPENRVKYLGEGSWGPRYEGSTRDIEAVVLKKAGLQESNVYGRGTTTRNLGDGKVEQENTLSYNYVYRQGKEAGVVQGQERYTRVVDEGTVLKERGEAAKEIVNFAKASGLKNSELKEFEARVKNIEARGLE